MNKKTTIGLLMLAAMVLVQGAFAYPGQTYACNGCHTYPPSTINITTNVSSITVNPGQTFTVNINWNGGNTAGITEVNWPEDFSIIGIVRDNVLFNPAPRIPASVLDMPSGTTSSSLTAPQTPGAYLVRVYASRKSPRETDYKDISVNVQAATPQLVSIAVTPVNPTISLGQTQQFTATGTYSDGSTSDITTSVTWASGDAGVATISSTGLASSVSAGTTQITASKDGITSPAQTLTVQAVPPQLVSIAVTPVNPTITLGQTQQFTATGTYSDGSTSDITTSVTWASGDAGVATISSAGLASSVSAGTTQITASKDGITSPAQILTVQAAPPATTYAVIFKVTDSKDKPVSGAKVELDGYTIRTNVSGVAVFTVAPGIYSYEVSKDHYKEVEDVVSVTGDTTISITLVREDKKKEHDEEEFDEEEHHESIHKKHIIPLHPIPYY